MFPKLLPLDPQLSATMEPRREQGTTKLRGVTRKTREPSNCFGDEDVRVQLQEVLELNRDLEVRLAARTAQVELLSHEFRTPLQAIVGYTELLEQEIHGPINDAQRRDLHRIRQCQEHLLGLIRASLDLLLPGEPGVDGAAPVS